jgi:lysophospholipid acyltransferase (LPLAT)-like uncharacterized protein
VWLSAATGHPIVPFHLEAERYWEIKSWDRTQIPKPFSRVAIVIGEPIYVSDTSETTVERSRQELEVTLAALERRARAVIAGGPA